MIWQTTVTWSIFFRLETQKRRPLFGTHLLSDSEYLLVLSSFSPIILICAAVPVAEDFGKIDLLSVDGILNSST